MITAQERQDRKLGLGGSDIPILLGMSNYMTPYQLWLEKTGMIEHIYEETPQQYWGKILEPVIRNEFASRHDVTVKTPKSITHPFHEFIRGNVDGYIPEWDAVLETKCSMQYMAKDWGESGSDIIPMSYILQVAYYCVLMNASCAHIAVLIGGNDYREFKYTRDDELEATIVKAAKEFWHYVKTQTPPPSMNAMDLKLQFPQHAPEKTVEANEKICKDLENLYGIKKQIKELEQLEEGYKFEIMNHMKDAECLVDKDGRPLVTFRANKKGARSFLLKQKD